MSLVILALANADAVIQVNSGFSDMDYRVFNITICLDADGIIP